MGSREACNRAIWWQSGLQRTEASFCHRGGAVGINEKDIDGFG